ncbi:MAG: hypothetical protein KF773_35585 [Deltaproteobacteria bacterium]|nr:hypothetical protein [Deltaproteobacteria bacterium]MCW5805426.1 hypothetical protein [Deltaproteobacteria bacterium]
MLRATSRLALVLALALAACRGDAEKCELACRNYYTLTFWDKADAEIAKLPAADQEQARSKMLAKFTSDIENGVIGCIGQCQSANNTEQTECMIAAKTASAAKACVED